MMAVVRLFGSAGRRVAPPHPLSVKTDNYPGYLLRTRENTFGQSGLAAQDAGDVRVNRRHGLLQQKPTGIERGLIVRQLGV
jgi:hypothetical protein